MRAARFFAVLTQLLAVAISRAEDKVAAPYQPLSGKSPVEIRKYQWYDQKRDRKVPVKIYSPREAKGPMPVIIFSHGLGGSRDGYEYLGRCWASNGYFCVHLQHLGSDTEFWGKVATQGRQAVRDAVNPNTVTNRVLDVSFAIDKVIEINKLGEFKDRLDLQKIGVGGHSFGAMTTLSIAGEIFNREDGYDLTMRDDRVKAIVAMSAPVEKGVVVWDGVYKNIQIPCLHLTGTRDVVAFGTTAKNRRIPYDEMGQADDYLVNFNGGDHMLFAGMKRGSIIFPHDPAQIEDIKISTTAFWDAYLKQDKAAKKWLQEGGFRAVLGGEGVFEKKVK